MDIIVSKFDHSEEFLMLYGLPPTKEVESLKMKIKESITPFVKKVLEVTPCIYRGNTKDDFFDGKMNGNWRIKVIPRNRVQIPNFIVVGSDVMGKAVYTKRLDERIEMCADCYRTGHFRRDCPGSREWSEYCKDFKEAWENIMKKENDEGTEEVHITQEDARLLDMIKEKEMENEMLQEEMRQKDKDLEKTAQLEKKIEEKDRKLKELESANQKHSKEIIGLQKISKCFDDAIKENENLKVRIDELMKEKDNLEENMRLNGESVKETHRRLSKSCGVELDTTVEDVGEINDGDSSDLPNLHGFSGYTSPEGMDVLDGKARKSILKRNNSSPGTGTNGQNKRKTRHPPIGAYILVETIEGNLVFRVKSKKEKSDSDYVYDLIRNNKMTTLNLKRMNWEFFDGAERQMSTSSKTN